MNKLLLASTALVASTTFAMADVDLSGFAEMGIFGGEASDGTSIDTQFHTDIDVTFSMSGETDAGLTFGASVDLDESIGDNNADDGLGESAATRDDSDDGGATIFVSGSLGTLTMGDTDGALDFAMTEAIIGSSLGDNHEHAGYYGNNGLDGTFDDQVARYDYSFGDFAIAVSAEIDDDPDTLEIDTNGDGILDDAADDFAQVENDTILGIGAKYNGEFAGISFGAGIGYQQLGMNVAVDTDGDGINDDIDDMDSSVIGASLSLNMENGIQAILNYSSFDESFLGGFEDAGLLDSHFGVAVGYEFGSFLVAVNYGKFDFEDGGDNSGIGVIANYDLGGGAELQAGYGRNEINRDDLDDQEYDTYSFGIAMAF